MNIEAQITNSVIAAVKDLYGQDVPEKMVALQKTRSDFEGNLTLVVFPLLKTSKNLKIQHKISANISKSIVGQSLTSTL